MQPSQQFLKRRKLMVFLPVLVIPFLTLFFWAMGGGQGGVKVYASQRTGQLNTSLPQAQPDNSPEDKLSLYQQALKKSEALVQARQQDPYSRVSADSSSDFMDDTSYDYALPTDPNEERVNEKLAAFKAALQQQPQMPAFSETQYAEQPGEHMAAALDQVQSAMQQAQEAGAPENDPELDKMNQMLQKIIDIQHPQAAKDRIEALSQQRRGQVFSIASSPKANTALLLSNPSGFPDSGSMAVPVGAFFDSPFQNGQQRTDNKAAPAVVNETQTLVSGATIKLRLTQDIFINGIAIPKGTFVFALCQLEGERMKATVQAVRYRYQLFPVALKVFDMDGIEGIKIPGAITRDAAKQGMEQGVQSLNLMMMDQSLGAQAASAGIQTAKSFLGHKARLVRATIRAGYPVLLVDDNKRNH